MELGRHLGSQLRWIKTQVKAGTVCLCERLHFLLLRMQSRLRKKVTLCGQRACDGDLSAASCADNSWTPRRPGFFLVAPLRPVSRTEDSFILVFLGRQLWWWAKALLGLDRVLKEIKINVSWKYKGQDERLVQASVSIHQESRPQASPAPVTVSSASRWHFYMFVTFFPGQGHQPHFTHLSSLTSRDRERLGPREKARPSICIIPHSLDYQ